MKSVINHVLLITCLVIIGAIPTLGQPSNYCPSLSVTALLSVNHNETVRSASTLLKSIITEASNCDGRMMDLEFLEIEDRSFKRHSLHFSAKSLNSAMRAEKVRTFLGGEPKIISENPFTEGLQSIPLEKVFNTGLVTYRTSHQMILVNQSLMNKALKQFSDAELGHLFQVVSDGAVVMLSLYSDNGDHEELFALRRFSDLQTALTYIKHQIQVGAL